MLTLTATASVLLRLAIFYGYPSLVNGSAGDIARAAAVFSRYDVVVFGDGLELAGTPGDAGITAERQRLPALLGAIHAAGRGTAIYGYIDLGSTQRLSIDEIDRRIEAWRRAGADGIFYDEAGDDFEVTAVRRHIAVCRAHARDMPVVMNAFHPGDLFEPAPTVAACDGTLGPRDALLVESFAVRRGVPQAARTDDRLDAALQWRHRVGVRVFAVTTTDARPFQTDVYAAARRLAEDVALDAFGWGENDFSADSRLPWRE